MMRKEASGVLGDKSENQTKKSGTPSIGGDPAHPISPKGVSESANALTSLIEPDVLMKALAVAVMELTDASEMVVRLTENANKSKDKIDALTDESKKAHDKILELVEELVKTKDSLKKLAQTAEAVEAEGKSYKDRFYGFMARMRGEGHCTCPCSCGAKSGKTPEKKAGKGGKT